MKIKPVKIEAVDWAIYDDARFVTDDFSPINCIIIGNLIQNNADGIAIALETFVGQKSGLGKVREVVCIPHQCIQSLQYLCGQVEGEKKGDEGADGYPLDWLIPDSPKKE